MIDIDGVVVPSIAITINHVECDIACAILAVDVRGCAATTGGNATVGAVGSDTEIIRSSSFKVKESVTGATEIGKGNSILATVSVNEGIGGASIVGVNPVDGHFTAGDVVGFDALHTETGRSFTNIDFINVEIVGIVSGTLDGHKLGASGNHDGVLCPIGIGVNIHGRLPRKGCSVIGGAGKTHLKRLVVRATFIPERESLGTGSRTKLRRNQELIGRGGPTEGKRVTTVIGHRVSPSGGRMAVGHRPQIERGFILETHIDGQSLLRTCSEGHHERREEQES